jgi:hypothetical protein
MLVRNNSGKTSSAGPRWSESSLTGRAVQAHRTRIAFQWWHDSLARLLASISKLDHMIRYTGYAMSIAVVYDLLLLLYQEFFRY